MSSEYRCTVHIPFIGKTAPVAWQKVPGRQLLAVSSFGCRELFLVGRRGGEVIKLQPFWVTVGQLFTLGEAVEDGALPADSCLHPVEFRPLLPQGFAPWALPNTS